MTSASVRRQALARSCAAAALIVDIVAYIDTAQFVLPGPLRPDALEQLLAWFEWRISYYRRNKYFPKSRRILIQQPTEEDLFFLSIFIEQHFLNRVDIAFDYLTATKRDARKLHNFFECHLVQSWSGSRRIGQYIGTNYWARDAWTRRQLVTYSDLPSKLTGGPCCHVEVRYRRKDACARRGIATIGGLVALNLTDIWDREFWLKMIDQRRLERTIKREAGYMVRCMIKPQAQRSFWDKHRNTEHRTRKPQTRAEFARLLKRNIARCIQTSRITPELDRLDRGSAQSLKDISKEYGRTLAEVPRHAFRP